MIAVVTSTLKPLNQNGKSFSFYSFEERLEQTKKTLSGLNDAGFDKIFLIDNSPGLDQLQLQNLLKDFTTVTVHHIRQYQFINKGINELLMLLYMVEFLPVDQAIFKISGRYYPSAGFQKPDFDDFALRSYHYSKRTGTVSTRAYWIKNAAVFHTFLLRCLNEIFAYPERIVGIKSLFRVLFTKRHNEPLNISIEFAAANVLKTNYYQIKLLDHIGIEGLIAGTNHKEKITE